MLCSNPYLRNPDGATMRAVMVSKEARTNATPFGCGKCLHCKINKAREWTHRLMLEQSVASDSCFLTLTYNDENLPEKNQVSKREMQLFIKRLRKEIENVKIRYLVCGEYGELSERPHYHCAIFGISDGYDGQISKAWNKGYIQIGDLTRQSARYMCGYIIKNMRSEDDIRLKGRNPEFMLSSKKNGGIGIGAIKQIAQKLNQEEYYSKDKVLRELSWGRSKLPLGRYLTCKLNEALEISEEVKENELLKYQFELFDKYLKDDMRFFKNVMDDNKQKRLKQEKIHRIYKSRRMI